MVQTYNEFKVKYDIEGNVTERVQTKRATVRISEQTANVNNTYSNSTELLYEVVVDDKKKIEKEYRKGLFDKAKELGIDVPKNIKTEDLETKLNVK